MNFIKISHVFSQLILIIFSLCSTLTAQDVISDSVYNDEDWNIYIQGEFGGWEQHEQRLNGGNADAFRYMEHILPLPPGPADLTRVEVTHIFEGDAYLAFDDINYIDYSEDYRLLNLPWEQAFIVSYPAIRQSLRYFRATKYLRVIGDTLWHSGSLTGLTENDFIALDGSGDHPDFSDEGGFLFFGFWRISTRGATLPPISPEENLVYQHGSDNFKVTIYTESPDQRPVAVNDEYLYLDYFSNNPKSYPVLENDYDPNGDSIFISSVDEPAFGGTIRSFNNNSINYSVEEPFIFDVDSDFFTYEITDGIDSSLAFVNIYFCTCPIECISLFLASPENELSGKSSERNSINKSSADSLDVNLFRKFRDDVLISEEKGISFIDFYYQNAAEIIPLLIFENPELGLQAIGVLKMMQEPVENLTEGDGTFIISQELVDSANDFLNNLRNAVSDSLLLKLNKELDEIGPLQELAGLTVSDAVKKTIGDSISTNIKNDIFLTDFILEQNYPNPFNPLTKINYTIPEASKVQLKIYNVDGQEIITLVDEFQSAGKKSVIWKGTDSRGKKAASGIYFYRLKAGDKFEDTKKLILIK